MKNNSHNPDILSCLANLSNDEVFTPPSVANKILDMLPKQIWSDENANFVQATVINVNEAYFHCPRSFKFANLWDAETIKSNASRSIASLKAT